MHADNLERKYDIYKPGCFVLEIKSLGGDYQKKVTGYLKEDFEESKPDVRNAIPIGILIENRRKVRYSLKHILIKKRRERCLEKSVIVMPAKSAAHSSFMKSHALVPSECRTQRYAVESK